jgi:hypothetical protein
VQWMKDPENPLRKFVVIAGIYLGTFLAGGLVTFAYSYHPLHNAKNWQIEYLESRMAAKTTKLESVKREVGKLRTEALGRPDFETFENVQDGLGKAEKKIASLEKKAAWSDSKIAELERSRASWKNRASEAESKADRLADAAATAADDAERLAAIAAANPPRPARAALAPVESRGSRASPPTSASAPAAPVDALTPQ